MLRAIELALKGMGRTSPNPMVGAVIVKGGRIVGEGYHRRAGTPHAEVHALREAGRAARDSEIYVTLEPCVHQGRTPPCVYAIIAAGIKCIFVGARDPNPLVSGRGIKALRAAGIKVEEGLLGEECYRINEAYNKFIVSGVPLIIAKAALSLDGKIATSSGDSRWITNEECRRFVHALRSQVDAVMVGGGTVRSDNPRLDVRLIGKDAVDPKAIMVDEKLNVPRTSRIFKRRRGELIVATTVRANKSMRRWIEEKGHTVITCRATGKGYVFIPHMLDLLGGLGITSILLEGGGELFSDFFNRRLVDRLVACIAPKLIGGKGKEFLPGFDSMSMKRVIQLRHINIHTFGCDIVVDGEIGGRRKWSY